MVIDDVPAMSRVRLAAFVVQLMRQFLISVYLIYSVSCSPWRHFLIFLSGDVASCKHTYMYRLKDRQTDGQTDSRLIFN